MKKSVIEQIADGMKTGRELYEQFAAKPGVVRDNIAYSGMARPGGSKRNGSRSGGNFRSELCRGDNLIYMKELLDAGFAGRFKLIYIDPPFFTRSSFNASLVLRSEGGRKQIHHLAYDDKFDRNLEYYIENMTARIMMMRELLADDGLIWVHLDWHSSHYIKLVMDELMGEKNFVNEIIWCYKSGGSGKRSFARKHDSILVYSKTGKYYLNVPLEKSYNRDYKPYRFKGVEEFRDEVGWYTMVNMKDVWSIDMVGRTSAERTGYATQKPLELMKRIIESSSREGDLVGDFFCGSGSFPEAAETLGRKWVGCDSEQLAVSMARKRLLSASADFSYHRISNQNGSGTDSLREGGIDSLSEGYIDNRSGAYEEELAGRAAIRVKSRDELEDGRFLYKCELTDLVPDIDTGNIQLSDRKHVDSALRDNRLGFADYIMISTGVKEESIGKEASSREGATNDIGVSAGEGEIIEADGIAGERKNIEADGIAGRNVMKENDGRAGERKNIEVDGSAERGESNDTCGQSVNNRLICDYLFKENFSEMTFIAYEAFSATVVDLFGKEYLADIDNSFARD